MADLGPVNAGDELSAKQWNAVLEIARASVDPKNNPEGGLASFGFRGTFSRGVEVRTAYVTRTVTKQQANIFDTTVDPSAFEHNALLMSYDPIAKQWSVNDDEGITIFLLDDGIDASGTGALPIPKDSQIAVYYSKSAQAWFPLSQPKEAVVRISSGNANPNSIQSGEMVVWDGSQWIVTQSVSVIRIGN